MKRVVVIIAVVLALGQVSPAPAAAAAGKTLQRMLDPVVVTGRDTGLTGRPIAGYGLFAVNDGELAPIPFQIDRRDADGNFLLTAGKEAVLAENPQLDDNDELVFMAMDTGDQLADEKQLSGKNGDWVELQVTDPVTQEMGWAYLVTGDCPPETSPVDYVSYDADDSAFATRNYSGRYDEDHPVGACRYAFEEGVGGQGEDFIDRIKVRVTMRSMGVTLHRSEEDIKVKELGYIDGPVRVIVYSKNVTPLVLGIPASATRQYTYYYDSFADFAFAASFPLKPGYFRAVIIDDFTDARGWTFYNSNNPGGHVIDGQMDETDRRLDPSPWTWGALTNDEQCFWSVWKAPPGCPVQASLYFNDKEESNDEMEDEEGELPGIGFDFDTGWDQLEEDRVELRLVHFYTRGYRPGMEKVVGNVYGAPLVVSSTPF